MNNSRGLTKWVLHELISDLLPEFRAFPLAVGADLSLSFVLGNGNLVLGCLTQTFHGLEGHFRQRLQCLDILVGRLVLSSPVGGQSASRSEVADGNGDQAAYEGLAIGFERNAGIEIDVFNCDRLATLHDPSTDTAAKRNRCPFQSGPTASSST